MVVGRNWQLWRAACTRGQDREGSRHESFDPPRSRPHPRATRCGRRDDVARRAQSPARSSAQGARCDRARRCARRGRKNRRRRAGVVRARRRRSDRGRRARVDARLCRLPHARVLGGRSPRGVGTRIKWGRARGDFEKRRRHPSHRACRARGDAETTRGELARASRRDVARRHDDDGSKKRLRAEHRRRDENAARDRARGAGIYRHRRAHGFTRASRGRRRGGVYAHGRTRAVAGGLARISRHRRRCRERAGCVASRGVRASV